MKILIGADLVPTDSNVELFENAKARALLGDDLLNILLSADYRIFNLEVPLTDEPSPIKKRGPNLIAPTSTVNGYCAMGVDLLTLANNHIMDQGSDGLFSTLETLKKNNIGYVGAGENLEDAKKPFIIDADGKKIGIYGCAEHEFSIADEKTPGANSFDPIESLDHIAALKAICDYVIVLYHGGKEHYRYPSPYLQKICRKMIDKGANLVVCQHSHCIGCEEKYNSGTIVYGQGNFLFDRNNSDYWRTGLLIQVNDDLSLSYFALVKNENSVRLAKTDEANVIMKEFDIRSKEIIADNFIQKKYAEYAMKNKEYYLAALCGINTQSLFFRILNKLSGHRYLEYKLRKKYSGSGLLEIQNLIECETHHELIMTIIKESKVK